MSTVRLRRLAADFARLKAYTKQHPRLKLLQTDGDPPERYQIEYRVKSMHQVDSDTQVIKKDHTVEITLPRQYPRLPPQCRMLTPVFHPNIAPHAICVGDHWSPGESLTSIVSRIGEMLAYQSYNLKSPLNGEAARWTAENEDRLPLDAVSMLVDEPEPAASQTANPANRINDREAAAPQTSRPTAAAGVAASRKPEAAPANAPDTLTVNCPQCDRRYKVPATAAGRKANCSVCDAAFLIPPPADQT